MSGHVGLSMRIGDLVRHKGSPAQGVGVIVNKDKYTRICIVLWLRYGKRRRYPDSYLEVISESR